MYQGNVFLMKSLREIIENIQLKGIDKVVKNGKVIGTISSTRSNDSYTAHHHASGRCSTGHNCKVDAANALDRIHAEYNNKKPAAA
jgi:hypothetical protein